MTTRALSSILLWLACLSANALSVFIEAEEFENLPLYGNFADVKGWYTKRHCHASGGAFVVSHGADDSMVKLLDKPFPAGTYTMYLRPCFNRSFGTTNRATVSIGNIDAEGKFTERASAVFVQDCIGPGYTWIKLTPQFELEKPCNAIRVTTDLVQNKGIGDDPEYPLPYLIIDSMIVTDEKVEMFKPIKRRPNHELKFPEARDPRVSASKLPYPKPGAPANCHALSQRPAFVSRKNLLRNSSFELCLKPHFTASNASRLRSSGYNVDADCLCTDNPFHGKYCIRLVPKPARIYEDYEGRTNSITLGGAVSFFAFNTFLGKQVAELAAEPGLTVSVYVRTNGKPVTFRICKQQFKLDVTDWTRVHAPLDPKYLKGDVLGFETTDPGAEIWLDAIQVERGKEPTDYIPLEGLEIGFQFGQTANITYNSGSLPLECCVSQASGKSERLEIDYVILDYVLEKQAEGTLNITSSPGKTVTKSSPVPFSELGSFLYVYTVKNHPEQNYIIPFYVIEKPLPKPRSRMLGAITDTNPGSMKVFSHAGFDWINTLQDEIIQRSWIDKDTVRFYDRYINMWQDKYDIQYAIWKGPFQIPWRFKKDPTSDAVQFGREAAAHMGRPNASLEYWKRYWEIVSRHYTDVKVWLTTDEQSYHRAASESIPYIESAVQIIKRNIKHPLICNSSQTLHFFQMLEMKPDLDFGDAFGGSRHGLPRTMYFYDRRLKDVTGKQFWALAVGWWVPDSWYVAVNFETFETKPGALWAKHSVNQVLGSLFNEAAIAGVERFGIYTAKFDGGSDPKCIFARDSTIKPFGIQFINTVNFLRDHKRGNVIHLDTAYGLTASYLERSNGKTCVMLHPDNTYGMITVNLDLPPNKVKLYDVCLNPMPFAKQISLPVHKSILIEDNGLGAKELIKRVRTISAFPVDHERRLILPSAKGTDLAIFKEVDDKPTMQTSTPMPPEAGIQYPVDQTKKNPEYSWASVAMQVGDDAVTLDADLSDLAWKKVAASSIYCWPGLGGSYQAMQGIKDFAGILSLNDFSITFKTLWCTEGILMSFHALDDNLTPGDGVVVRIDTDLLGDLYDPAFSSDDFEVTIMPEWKAGSVIPAVKNSAGEQVGTGKGSVRITGNGFQMEILIPFSALGIEKPSQCSMGLGLDAIDSDASDEKPALLSWTADSAPRRSPWGFGQLVLKLQN